MNMCECLVSWKSLTGRNCVTALVLRSRQIGLLFLSARYAPLGEEAGFEGAYERGCTQELPSVSILPLHRLRAQASKPL